MAPPMILGIESATSRVGCALGDASGVLAARSSARPRRHAESLAPQIAEVLEESGVGAADIEVVAVDVGPGLYTGLRVGITTAVTMAHALGAVMVPVTSLELVARSAARAAGEHSSAGTFERIDAVVDARRGELFHAAFSAEGEPITEPAVVDPEVLAETLRSTAAATLLVGDGVEAHEAVFAQVGLGAARVPVYPSAETAVELAAAAAAAGRALSPGSVRPLYLRGPDARPMGIVA